MSGRHLEALGNALLKPEAVCGDAKNKWDCNLHFIVTESIYVIMQFKSLESVGE
jgi:hypothetical protein